MTVYPGGSYGYPGSVDIMEGALGVFLGVYLFVMLLVVAVSVVFYVLQAVSYYTIAKRRGIRNPWLAWLPVGSEWILGSISDQYQYVKHGKVKNRRKIMLGLSIATYGASLLYSMVSFVIGFLAEFGGVGETGIFVMFMLLFALVFFGLSIAMCIFLYITLYDLYSSCDPTNAVLYLILGIFVSVTMPFFLFSCRNKDDGMPPRRDAIPQQPQPYPGWTPPQQPAAPQPYPGWTPPQQPVVFPTEPTAPISEEPAVLTPQSVEPTATIPEEKPEE